MNELLHYCPACGQKEEDGFDIICPKTGDVHDPQTYREGLRDGLQWVIDRGFSPSHELDLRMAMRRVEDTGRLLGETEGG